MVDIISAKEMSREKDCWSFAMNQSCVEQTHGLKRRKRGK